MTDTKSILPHLTKAKVALFWSRVAIRPTGCWEWTRGKSTRFGYGKFSFTKYVKRFTHRIAYTIYTNTEIPPGLLIRHKCDNGSCVNPLHLETGTHADNHKDMRDRGRMSLGENRSIAKLTNAAVREIRRQLTAGVQQSVLAKMYGVHQCNISRVGAGDRWNHVTDK